MIVTPDSGTLMSFDEAEQLRQSGHFEQAITVLEKALAFIEKVEHPISAEYYTRLALLYQQSGQCDKGWHLLNHWLDHGLAGKNRYTDPAQIWLDRATLCDRIRLFCQRDNRWREAVIYDFMFYICRVTACAIRPENCNLRAIRSKRAIWGALTPTLRRAQLLTKRDPLTELMTTLFAALPDMDFDSARERVTRILAEK